MESNNNIQKNIIKIKSNYTKLDLIISAFLISLIIIFILIISSHTSNKSTIIPTTPIISPTQPIITPSIKPKEDPPYIIDTTWIDPNKPIVALTFDDGPYIGGTSSKIYDYLKTNNIKATFFLSGIQLEKHPEAIEIILDMGSQIANHTYSHSYLTKLTPEEIIAEEQKVISIIEATGHTQQCYLIRLPYGAYNDLVVETLSAPIILWNKDSIDWACQSVEEILNNLKDIKDGDIILMHDIKELSYQGLIALVPLLQKQDFQFVTIDELFQFKNIELLPGKIYYSGNDK